MLDPISTVALVKVAEKVAKSVSDGLIGKLKTKIAAVATDKSVDISHKLFNSFKTYIENSQTRYSYFLTLAIPNEKLLLEDFYLPLTLIKKSSEKSEVVVSGFPIDLVEMYKDILVVDTAGMGKSTLLKYLFINATQFDNKIPIFIELRHLSKSKKIIDYIFEELKAIDKDLDKPLVRRLLNSGEFLILLDGYDEIEESQLEAVTNDILSFKQKANANSFILSSRDQSGLTSFPDFQKFTIKPLKVEEAYLLLKKYSRNSVTGDELISKLKLPANSSVYEFLQNPLLVSLLFKAYEYTPTIPNKKHLFYRQVYDALFERHDFSKGSYARIKKSSLDTYAFFDAISALGFETIQKGRTEYNKSDILRYIKDSKKYNPDIIYQPALFLDDLTHAVPFLTEEGPNFRWNHKSLQEYFAAAYLSSSSDVTKEAVLDMICRSHKASSYINFLTLYSDLDATGFRRYFIGSLLKYLKEDLVRRRTNNLNRFPNDLVEKYLSQMFFQHIGILKNDPNLLLTTQDKINNQASETHQMAFEKFKELGFDLDGVSGRHPMHSMKGNIVVFSSNFIDFISSLYKQGLIPTHIFSKNNLEDKSKSIFEELLKCLNVGIYVNEDYSNNSLYQQGVFEKFVDVVSILSPFIIDLSSVDREIGLINEELKKEGSLKFNF